MIRQVRIVDGTGAPPFEGEVAINGDTIVKVGKVEELGWREIWAEGLVLAPGFIDIHSHSDFSLLQDGRGLSKIMQGVTTEVVGNCGMSPHPAPRELHRELCEAFGYAGFVEEEWDFETTAEYLSRLERRISVNLVALVGHGTLRASVVGFEKRRPSGEEMERMLSLLDRSLSEGAAGLSVGLIYPPSSYAEVEELCTLARLVAERGGILSCHLRSESDRLLEALEEMAEVARRSGVFVEVSHLKCAGEENWGKSAQVLDWFEERMKEGLRLGFDAYPYEAGSTHLSAYLPEWAKDGGAEKMLARLSEPRTREEVIRQLRSRTWRPSRLRLVHLEAQANRDLIGLSLEEAARKRNLSPEEMLVELVREEGGKALVVSFAMSQQDVDRIICHPQAAIGSDGSAISPEGPFSGSLPHPRSYGTFPRVLRRYVNELHRLSLEEAVRKMTSLPASRLGLRDRGIVKPGAKADLVLLRAEEIEDKATYDSPHKFPEGVEWVIVNGVPVVEHGEYTGELPGRVLPLKGS